MQAFQAVRGAVLGQQIGARHLNTIQIHGMAAPGLVYHHFAPQCS